MTNHSEQAFNHWSRQSKRSLDYGKGSDRRLSRISPRPNAAGVLSLRIRVEGVQGYTTTPQRACETQWRSEREGNIK